MVIVKEREFQLSLRRVLIVVGRVLIVVDQDAVDRATRSGAFADFLQQRRAPLRVDDTATKSGEFRRQRLSQSDGQRTEAKNRSIVAKDGACAASLVS